MKRSLCLAALAAGVLMTGCGADEKISEMQQAYDNVQALTEAGEKIEDAQKRMEERMAERRKRGDTLAMPYQALIAFLPSSVAGYTAAEPEGETTNMSGFSLSTARRTFTNDQGETVRVEIVDYNAAYSALAAYTALWQAGFSSEDTHGYRRAFDPGIGYAGGWEEYNKDSKSAKVHYALGDRFFVTIESDNKPDTQFARDIASSMSLKELAAK